MTKTVMNLESDDKNYKLQKSATQLTFNSSNATIGSK